MKPYYETELGKLYHGDCLEILPQLTEKVDLVLTDIPYNEVNRSSNGLRNLDKGQADSARFDMAHLLAELFRLCSGSFYIFCGTEQVSPIRANFVESGLSTRHGVWIKPNPSPMNGEYIYLSALENVIFGKKSGAYFNGFCLSPVWRHPTVMGQEHPTEKPVKMFQEMLHVSTGPNGTVLDPFLGSGTTAVACERLGRRWIGIEISEEYCDIAVKRIEQERAQMKLSL